MRNKILLSALILLMALLLPAFKAPKKDPRVISPDVAALVVASKPLKMPDSIQITSDLLTQNNPDSNVNARGYLDSEITGTSEQVAQDPAEAGKQTGEPEIPDNAALMEKRTDEAMEQTEIVASIHNNVERIEKTETDSRAIPDIMYTIQTGSFQNYVYAQDQFDTIMETLSQEELDYLRIETIGQFNAVRLGRFEDYKSAEEFLTEITPRITDAIILKAYIIDDRITQQLVE